MRVRAWAPGRVNLIGEHTDYTGGLVLPMAIQLGTTIDAEVADGRISLRSDAEPEALELTLPVIDPASVTPAWGRYVAGVAAELAAEVGLVGTITSTVPPGAGLSSSAALEVAVAVALTDGDHVSAVELARVAQRAEQRSTGVACGIMDQLASAGGVEGHALRVDCETLDVTPVAVPEAARIVVVHSGQERTLAGSEYETRRRQCEEAEAVIGPLRLAAPGDLDALDDPVLHRRARHVVSENARVDAFAAALTGGDLSAAGGLMGESHRSLRDDFEVSTPVLDELVAHLTALDGVYGARLTGAGFGGCVVALCRPDVDPRPTGLRGWIVEPSAGARLL